MGDEKIAIKPEELDEINRKGISNLIKETFRTIQSQLEGLEDLYMMALKNYLVSKAPDKSSQESNNIKNDHNPA